GIAGDCTGHFIDDKLDSVIASGWQLLKKELLSLNGKHSRRDFLDMKSEGVTNEFICPKGTQDCLDFFAHTLRPVDLKVPGSRVNLRPGGSMKIGDQVREMIGVKVREDNMSEVILFQSGFYESETYSTADVVH